MLGFVVNQKHRALAVAEIDIVVGVSGSFLGKLYIVDAKYQSSFERLAFTREVLDGTFDSRGMFKKDFAVDINKINHFEKRRAHLLPAAHPAMTHPRVARAMVNLSGARREVLDPFCGAGGILIEAGLCGLQSCGLDIDKTSLRRARSNLDFFGIQNYRLSIEDATAFSSCHEAVVTDLPYGLNTKITHSDLDVLYLSFLKNVATNNIKKAVVAFPDFVDYSPLIEKAGLSLTAEFTYYLHKNLSKKIAVLSLP